MMLNDKMKTNFNIQKKKWTNDKMTGVKKTNTKATLSKRTITLEQTSLYNTI